LGQRVKRTVLPEPPARNPTPRPAGRTGWSGPRTGFGVGTSPSFSHAKPVAFAIIDVVSRRWIDTLVSFEETSTQVEALFDRALIPEGLADLITPERLELPADDPRRPILLACSDNAPQSTSTAPGQFLAGLAVAQRLRRPHRASDQAGIEILFGDVKGEWPHLEQLADSALLDTELDASAALQQHPPARRHRLRDPRR